MDAGVTAVQNAEGQQPWDSADGRVAVTDVIPAEREWVAYRDGLLVGVGRGRVVWVFGPQNLVPFAVRSPAISSPMPRRKCVE